MDIKIELIPRLSPSLLPRLVLFHKPFLHFRFGPEEVISIPRVENVKVEACDGFLSQEGDPMVSDAKHAA